ncbi:MATE family efflux transporter [Qiania dongpingensis]|uniref:Probable multidrug resistance protein NorM n=1 Tax=Qiania dongpingensis TaxID=2763669 RepID=A0A7G9G6S0_9FIRM|nr:MATE family efflux transporter [Qiania dongpingensis]QNM06502.1 MATE family efflux transporter [Qiania dongpingensis]
MEDTPIVKLLWKLSPPVMLALLIQSVYNIVDSYFVSRYSEAGLTALSIIFPIQLLMTALATGTGTGINILISRMDGTGETKSQTDFVKSGLFLGLLNYLIFAFLGLLFIKSYYSVSSDQTLVQEQGIQYAQIVFVGSFGLFIESNCTKILQAKGNMVTPMIAQVTGAVINVIFDPILIFGMFGMPELGVAGAAIATIAGQIVAMMITFAAVCQIYHFQGKVQVQNCIQIYRAGIPSIIMQSLYTLYIAGLNLMLKLFTEDAVTVLGIYYKLQTFFFIPLMGLQQVILPIISFNYGAGRKERVRDTLKYSTLFSCGIMFVAVVIFMAIPERLLSIFSDRDSIIHIGCPALRIISGSFIPAGLVMMFTVYFQGIDRGKASIFITVLRQIVLLVPLAWIFHYAGLRYVWFTFVVTELIATIASLILYKKNKASRASQRSR